MFVVAGCHLSLRPCRLYELPLNWAGISVIPPPLVILTGTQNVGGYFDPS